MDYRLLVLRELTFYVSHIDIPEPFKLYWKVKNVGPEAIRRDMIRGDICMDSGARQITER